MSNFIELCLEGERLPKEIDDYVDTWHESDSNVPLYKFLGMTRKEYSLWVDDPDALYFILEAHRTGRDAVELIREFNALPIAARAESANKAQRLVRWLQDNGLWE
jgi:hypothetical protein